MPRTIALPPALLKRPFSVRTALELGVGKGRMRSRDLRTPFHGVRSPVGAPTDLRFEAEIIQRAIDYVPRLRAGQFFCGITALAILGLPLPRAWADRHLVHVGSIAPAMGPRTTGARGHRYRSVVLWNVGGLPVSSPIDAWLQLAPFASVDDLIVIGDGLVRRKNPFATRAALVEVVRSLGSRRGKAALDEAIPQIRENTDSAQETRLRLFVVRAGFPEPVVNPPIRNERGVVIAHGDLVFEEYFVILEYEGAQHFDDPRQFRIDVDRIENLMGSNYRVIRVMQEHLSGGGDALVRRIDTALRAAGWQP